MNIAKEILARIFALWGMIVFITTMLVALLPIWLMGLLKEPKRTIYVFKIFRTWMDSFFFAYRDKKNYYGQRTFQKGRELHCSL